MTKEVIIDSLIEERRRQDRLHTWNHKTNRLAVLTEELGEIAAALQGEGDLEEELVQLAAACVRWLEEL